MKIYSIFSKANCFEKGFRRGLFYWKIILSMLYEILNFQFLIEMIKDICMDLKIKNWNFNCYRVNVFAFTKSWLKCFDHIFQILENNLSSVNKKLFKTLMNLGRNLYVIDPNLHLDFFAKVKVIRKGFCLRTRMRVFMIWKV